MTDEFSICNGCGGFDVKANQMYDIKARVTPEQLEELESNNPDISFDYDEVIVCTDCGSDTGHSVVSRIE